MSDKQVVDELLAEIADEAESAERTADPDAPLPAHVKVSRPGRARSRVLQVRLNPEEMAALEAVAVRRGLPVSTVAREQILQLAEEDAAAKADPMSKLLDVAERAQAAAEFIRRFVTTTRTGGDPTAAFLDSALLKIGTLIVDREAGADDVVIARELMTLIDAEAHFARSRTDHEHMVKQVTQGRQVAQHRAMADKPNSRHVVPHEGGGWDIKKPGSDRAVRHFDTQKEAIDKGRQILKNDGGGELNIHDQQGKIRAKDTIAPGNDPYPPKG